MDDLIDLRWYGRVLRRGIRLVVLAAGVLGLAAFAFARLQPPVYRATTDLLLLRYTTDLIFDARVRTIAEDQTAVGINQDVRRATLLTFSNSPVVISRTLASLPPALAEEWPAERLLSALEVTPKGNLITLAVRGPDPAEAAQLVDAWAAAFVAQTNRLFSAPELASAGVAAELVAAQTRYQQAEQALIAGIATSEEERLAAEIAARRQALTDLLGSRQSAARVELERLLTARWQLPLVRADAETLRAGLAGRPGDEPVTAGTRLTVLLLETRALSSTATLPAGVQLVLSPSDADATVAETLAALDDLVARLAAAEQALDAAIEERSVALLAQLEPGEALATPVALLQADLRQLNQRLETELARRRELSATRDLAWGSYLALASKSQELAIGAGLADSEVVVVAPAAVPDTPEGSGSLTAAALGAALGALLALIALFLRAYLFEPAEAPARREREPAAPAPAPGDP